MSAASTFLRWVGVLTLSFFVIFVVLPLLVILTLTLFAGAMKGEQLPALKNLVSVVEVEGMIVDSREILETLYDQADDPNVNGIVLRINSPGGAIGPAQEIYAAIKKIQERKPVISSMGAVAASGGLYAALSSSRIYCQPGTLTGSIGVILQIPNVQKLSDFVGVSMRTIKSGQLKDAGNVFREMEAQERDYLQDTVDKAYEQFLDAVIESRKLDPAKIRPFSDGRIILGSDAVELGLADGIGDIDTAARAVFEELNRPLSEDESPNLFYPMDKMKWLRQFITTSSYINQLIQGHIRFSYLMG